MARRKKLLYPGIEEVEQERRKAEKRYEQEENIYMMDYDTSKLSYDEYQRWLIIMNID